MRYAVQSSIPSCPRLLLQADDDADGLELALAIAKVWARSKLVLVVNGTGRDLSGYAARGHEFAVLLDDADRPTRSLAEIAEAFSDLDASQVGCVVVADTNRIYRATRCAVLEAKRIRDLLPGDWDQTNESLGSACEALTRAGIPSIFLAPSTDERGLNADNVEVTIGSKPQAWKDLRRTAQVQLHAQPRRGRPGVEVVILGDDHRSLGRVGEVLDATDPRPLADSLAVLVRDCRSTIGGTTLAESTATELAARKRREERDLRESATNRDRIVGLADVRACQGALAFAELEQEMITAVLLPSDRDAASRALEKAARALGRGTQFDSMLWIDSAEATLEQQSVAGLRSFTPVFGPDPTLLRGVTAKDVGELLGRIDDAPMILRDSERHDLLSWIAALGWFADVWTEPRLAVVSGVCRLPAAGPDWGHYTNDQLLGLAMTLASYAGRIAMFDPREQVPNKREGDSVQAEPPVTTSGSWEEPEPAHDAAGEDVEAGPACSAGLPVGDDDWERTLAIAGASSGPRLVEPHVLLSAEALAADDVPRAPARRTSTRDLEMPAAKDLLAMTAARASSYVIVALDRAGLADQLDDVCEQLNVNTGRRREPVTWAPAEREAVYAFALGRILRHAA